MKLFAFFGLFGQFLGVLVFLRVLLVLGVFFLLVGTFVLSYVYFNLGLRLRELSLSCYPAGSFVGISYFQNL